MTFRVQIYSHGILRQTHNAVPAYKHANMARIPDYSKLAPSLAPAVRAALQRATWEIVCSDTLRADLTDRKGRPIGTLIANWSN